MPNFKGKKRLALKIFHSSKFTETASIKPHLSSRLPHKTFKNFGIPNENHFSCDIEFIGIGDVEWVERKFAFKQAFRRISSGKILSYHLLFNVMAWKICLRAPPLSLFLSRILLMSLTTTSAESSSLSSAGWLIRFNWNHKSKSNKASDAIYLRGVSEKSVYTNMCSSSISGS